MAALNRDPNLAVLDLVVEALGDLAEELVLVGGCAVGLLVTDPAGPSIRATVDVDLITEAFPTSGYYALCDRLRARGFAEARDAGVLCSWTKAHLVVDVMPTRESVLSFTNSWYEPAARHAVAHELPSGARIRVITAPYFVASKLESFASRAAGDYLHHDMEDIVAVVDGRDEFARELAAAAPELQAYVQDELATHLASSEFIDRLAWLLPPAHGPARRETVIRKLRSLAGY